MENILTGKDIMKIFGEKGEEIKALDKVSVSISKGEFVAVMGASGGGKSTLLFALSGMDDITSGSVKFDEVELSGLNDKQLADIRRTKMGFVFQQPTMLKNLNLLDNIILPVAQNRAGMSPAQVKQKARMLMEKTGINQLGNRDITEVSGGQLQRAGICRALMTSPEILFADEPTGALNSKASEEIMDLLSGINNEGTAILLVTHDVKVAARASRVLFMKDGKIISEIQLDKFKSHSIGIRADKILAHAQQIGI
ncbi:ABC transporter ATP-binding protein [Lacrimispora sp. AGF001]|uniref:ABC transporter ATP-binding protein n=1 Tax=Lacrimispora sp. AGF001 TaxID=3401631 RepID=UPI003B4375DB|nr:ABC transporter ATP-binding protein [Paenibacillaceae bacterium]